MADHPEKYNYNAAQVCSWNGYSLDRLAIIILG